MVATLTNREQTNFIGFIEAIGEGDAILATHCLLDFSKIGRKQYTNQHIKLIQSDMIILFNQICRGYNTNVNIGNVLRGILNIIRIHHIVIETNYATLVMNILCLESMAKSLLPSYNVIDAARPLLQLHYNIDKKIPKFLNKYNNIIFKKIFNIVLYFKSRSDDKILKELLKQQKENNRLSK